MNGEVQKQTTEGITFRVPSSSIRQLREESKKKQVSLNTLVNQILKDHLDWHTFAAQARMFYVTRCTFSGIVDDLTEEELSKHAVTCAKQDFVDLGLLLRGEFSIPSFLNILENWSRISFIPYKHEKNNDVHNLIIQHDMGGNYSFFIKEMFRYILEETFERKSDFTITDNTVMVRFRED
jgi:hypothetical protein